MVEVPYLRVANVQRGALKLDEVSSIRVTPQKAQALELRAGDVLLNEGGDRDKLARGWVWEGEVPNCIHQNHVFRARLRIDLDPYFLSYTANTLGGRWAERNGKQSVNLASISLSMIRRMPVIVPPEGVSARVVNELRDRLEEVDRLEKAAHRSQAHSASLRRAILAAAFEGKLTGRHTDTEVIEDMVSGHGKAMR
jgi:type I restriction enzyme S subunit